MPHDLITSKDPADIRRRKEQRLSALRSHRAMVLHRWMEIGAQLMPEEGRFSITDRDRGGRHKSFQIVNSMPMQALNISRAGIRSGTASPERKWFDFDTMDPDLNRSHEVREWLDLAVKVLMLVFAKSNTYRVLDGMWGELLGFNTSCSLVTSSFDRVIHLYPSPVGEFFLAQDNEGTIDTFYREFEWTVGETVDEFGFNAVSEHVQQAWRDGHLERPVTILETIEPRRVRNPQMADSRNMRFESVYMELGNSSKNAGILRESGYDHFPVLAGRWGVTGRNVYGHGPGMAALPDIRQLNSQEWYLGKGVANMADPPVQMPVSMKDLDRELFPGGVSFYDGASGPHGAIRTAYEVKIDINPLQESILRVEQRISRGLYADVFLMALNSRVGSEDRTAYEMAILHEEKLLQLGPTLQRLEQEVLSPLVNIAFRRVIGLDLLPPPPAELAGRELNVEFVGILAQAQRALTMKSNERWLMFMQALGNMKPESMDKINADEMSDLSARALGVEAKAVVPTERAEALRTARNQALAAKEQLEAAQVAASAAKDFSQAQPIGAAPQNIAEATGI